MIPNMTRKRLAILSEKTPGQTLEVAAIDGKIDLRTWDGDTPSAQGVSLNLTEAQNLLVVLQNFFQTPRNYDYERIANC